VIRDNAARGRFEMDVDGKTAFVSYRAKPDVIELLHSETPAELRGRGVGTRLARGVFDLLRERNAKVAVYCGFLIDFLRRHPEYRDLEAGAGSDRT